MFIKFQSNIGFASRTKKLRQVPGQHPEQTKLLRLTHRQARKLKPENHAYKTASAEEFETKLSRSGKSLLELTIETINKNKTLGTGSECTVFRIPIKGFEGYALRAYNFSLKPFDKKSILSAGGLLKSSHPLANEPNAGVAIAEFATNIGPFQVIRKLPGQTLAEHAEPKRGSIERGFTKAMRLLASQSQQNYNQFAVLIKKLTAGGYRRDNSTGNIMLLPDGNIGLIDTPHQYENWKKDLSKLPNIFNTAILFIRHRLNTKKYPTFDKQAEHYKSIIQKKVTAAIQAVR